MKLERATAPQLRRSLELGRTVTACGIMFVPMPVRNEAEFAEGFARMDAKLEEMALELEREK